MIYTLTFNPALDYVVELDGLSQNRINRSSSECIRYGGKGINVSAVLNNLGVRSRALGFIAGFSGDELERLVNEDGIESDFIHLSSGNTRINVKLKAGEDSYDINAAGPAIDGAAFEALMVKLTRLEPGDILVLAGSIPESLPSDTYERIMQRLDGKEVLLVVDAEGELLLNSLKHKPFLIKPNHIEFGALFNTKASTVDEIVECARRLQLMGARNVLVSRAQDGSVLVDENSQVHIIGNPPGNAINTVGCGDSMVAGFIAGYIDKKDYSYALKLGTACGSATAYNTTLATKKEIQRLLNAI